MPYGPRTDRTRDGLGQTLADDALYYVQDCRSLVGNCVSWWRPDGAGYACDLDDAGVYTGLYCRGMRDTDIPWPVEYVEQRTIRHVRGDSLALGGDRHLVAHPTTEQLDAIAEIMWEAPLPDGTRPDWDRGSDFAAMDSLTRESGRGCALAAWKMGARPPRRKACR